jgi:two-component system LytT family response regulator
MKIPTLLVNDDPVTRSRIRSLLSHEPDIAVIGDCTTDECAEVIDNAALICARTLLRNAGDVIRRIASGAVALIVTADSERHAVHAFDVGAADYVLEPFSDQRFALALMRARARLVRPPESSGMVVFKSTGRVHLLRDAEIHWCEAVGNYVRVQRPTATTPLRCATTPRWRRPSLTPRKRWFCPYLAQTFRSAAPAGLKARATRLSDSGRRAECRRRTPRRSHRASRVRPGRRFLDPRA